MLCSDARLVLSMAGSPEGPLSLLQRTARSWSFTYSCMGVGIPKPGFSPESNPLRDLEGAGKDVLRTY